MINYYLCVFDSESNTVEILDTFETLQSAIDAMDALQSFTDLHSWIGQVPSRLQKYEAEPILY